MTMTLEEAIAGLKRFTAEHAEQQKKLSDEHPEVWEPWLGWTSCEFYGDAVLPPLCHDIGEAFAAIANAVASGALIPRTDAERTCPIGIAPEAHGV